MSADRDRLELVNRLLYRYDHDPAFGVREFAAALAEQTLTDNEAAEELIRAAKQYEGRYAQTTWLREKRGIRFVRESS